MKEKATIPYTQLIDTIEEFSDDFVEDLNATEEAQIQGYTLQLALHLFAKFYFDKKEKEE